MDAIFVVRRYVEVAPVSELLFQRHATFLKRVKGHEVSPRFEERTSANRMSSSLLPALTKDARSLSPRVGSIVKCYRAASADACKNDGDRPWLWGTSAWLLCSDRAAKPPIQAPDRLHDKGTIDRDGRGSKKSAELSQLPPGVR